jgi:hypothetical protein
LGITNTLGPLPAGGAGAPTDAGCPFGDATPSARQKLKRYFTASKIRGRDAHRYRVAQAKTPARTLA